LYLSNTSPEDEDLLDAANRIKKFTQSKKGQQFLEDAAKLVSDSYGS